MKTLVSWRALGTSLCVMSLFCIPAKKLLADPLPTGYTCSGTCGSIGANGVVTLSPTGSSSYLYVTTYGSGASAPLPTGGLGSEKNGSTITTPVFTATAGSLLNYYFNFVTSDGSGYSDYSWAELFNSDGTAASLLFDARTEPTGSIVPGQGLPTPSATLNPSSVDIIGGAPVWSPLGSSSGACYAAGCGYTGWINSSYTIAGEGTYYLEFGVTNWIDQAYDTGLAIDGVTVNGMPVGGGGSVTPEPNSLLLLGSGIIGIGLLLARRQAQSSEFA